MRGGRENSGGGASSSARGSLSSRAGILDSDPGLDRLRAAMLTGRGRRHTEPEDLTIEPNFATNEVDLVRSVYWSTTELLTVRGMDVMTASRVALRVTRAVLLIGEVGLRETDAAQALDISDRQVRRDLALVRELGRDLLDPSPGLPRIPTPPDRILISGEAA
jgi:hypothetical protein